MKIAWYFKCLRRRIDWFLVDPVSRKLFREFHLDPQYLEAIERKTAGGNDD